MTTAASLPRAVKLCRDFGQFAALAEAGLRSDSRPGPALTLRGERTDAELGRLFPGLELAEAPDGKGCGLPVEDQVRRLLASGNGGDPARILVVDPARPHSLPAICYALATGRSVHLVPGLAQLDGLIASTSSAIVVGEAEAFGKARLKSLLEWTQPPEGRAIELGIVTGRDELQIFDLFAKMLLARHGEPATGPAYVLIGAHGNEMHLGYQDRILCGRCPAAVPLPARGFDCGTACPHADRIGADEILARAVFLISCDGFAPSGGLAPKAFSLLFRLLDGPAAAVLAPYKHVQANELLLVMIEAMARSGYSLGEIALAANMRANGGAPADLAHLVLGDPELQPLAGEQEAGERPQIIDTAEGVLIRGRCHQGQQALLCHVASHGVSKAVVPISQELRRSDIFCSLGVGLDHTDLVLFSDQPLPEGPIEFALVDARPPPRGSVDGACATLDGCRLFTTVIGDVLAVAEKEQALWTLLREASSFPHPTERLLAQNAMLNLHAILGQRFADLAGALCDALFEALAGRRLWISQDYGHLFGWIERAGAALDGFCPHCANDVTVWQYSDPLTRLVARHLHICSRCGIIADLPADALLRVEMETVTDLRSTEQPIAVRLVNDSDEKVRLSLAVQLNEWRLSRVGGRECRVDLVLEPNEVRTHCATLTFPDDFPDDILSVQAFVVTDELDLLFASQKVRSAVRQLAPAPPNRA